MKQKLFIFAAILVVLALPHTALAYDFSAVAPSGQTLYYNIVGNAVELVPGDVQPVGDLIIPDSVTYMGVSFPVQSIGSVAFSGCNGLTSVVIGGEVTSIGYDAFYQCNGLVSVILSNSVTSIGFESFECCTALTEIAIPNSVTHIDIAAFQGCTGLTTIGIPNSVTSIAYNAFKNCRNVDVMDKF